MKYFEGHRVQQGGGDVLEQDALLGPVRDRTNRVADVAKARVVRRRHHGDVGGMGGDATGLGSGRLLVRLLLVLDGGGAEISESLSCFSCRRGKM